MSDPIVFIELAEVERRVALRKSAIYKLMREGTFPKPAPVGVRGVRWVLSEVEQWQRERMEART